MSTVTVNGASAIRGEITIPRRGAWYGTIAVPRDSDPETIASVVEIGIGSQTWHGTVIRSGEDRGSLWARVVGGAGGLGKVLEPKSYRGVSARLPILELLQGAGETLSALSDAAPLALVLPFWSRRKREAGVEFASLIEAIGAPTWRVLSDGTIWIGTDTFAPSPLEAYVYLSQSPGGGFVDLFAEDPVVRPGETFRDRRVSTVVHRFDASTMQTRVWLEDVAGTSGDRAKEALRALVREAIPNVDMLAGYWAKVITQNADKTLELVPDDPRLHSFSGVPIRYGVPGVTAKVPAGARVLLEFAAGDPSKPVATAWEPTSPTEIAIGAGTNQPAALATALRTELDAIWAALYGGHVHVVAGVQAGTGTVTSATSVGSSSKQTIASAIVKVAT